MPGKFIAITAYLKWGGLEMAEQGKHKTGGRQKGTLNKTLALLKDAILEAADTAGGKAGLVGYLRLQARENLVAFMGLLGKLVPSQIAAEVTQSVATVRSVWWRAQIRMTCTAPKIKITARPLSKFCTKRSDARLVDQSRLKHRW
jgi:hypothetical protein